MPSSPPRDLETFLRRVIEKEDELELDSAQLDMLEEEAESLSPNDPVKLQILQTLTKKRYFNSKGFAVLAVIKAQYGVVGNTWYKS